VVRSLLDIPDERDASNLLDWIEATMLVENRRTYSLSRIERDLDLEAQELEDIRSELERRQAIGRQLYPFAESADAVVVEPDASPLYVFLLLVSISPAFRARAEWDEVNLLFDEIVALALRNFLGPGARGRRFSTPSYATRDETFQQQCEGLAKDFGLPLGPGPWRAARRDGGVDAVAWRPFGDRRPGFITVLAQCTVRRDWQPKARDIVIDLWRAWVDFGKDPVTALAVPFALPPWYDAEGWDEQRRTVHVMLDRFRLTELLATDPPDLPDSRPWVERELDRNRAAAA
jgi:hypothetical protein